jgi:hypothetical protein
MFLIQRKSKDSGTSSEESPADPLVRKNKEEEKDYITVPKNKESSMMKNLGQGLLVKQNLGAGVNSVVMPALVPTVVFRKVFRWYCTFGDNGSTITPTWLNMFRALSIQTSSTSATPLISSIRLRCVTIYYNNLASTAATTPLLFKWMVDSAGNPAISKLPRSSGSIGVKMVNPAPKNSIISLWHTSADDLIVDTDPFCEINVGSGVTMPPTSPLTCVIDIDCDYTLCDGYHLAKASFTTATNTTLLMTQSNLTTGGTGSSSAFPLGYQATV